MTVEDAPEELVWLVEAYLSSGMHREQAWDLVEYLQPRRGTLFLLGDSLTVKLTKPSDFNDDHIRINDRTSPIGGTPRRQETIHRITEELLTERAMT